MEEIKPCPFCGNKAEVFERLHDGESLGKYDVRCTSEYCYLEEGADWYFRSEKEAIKWWNRRKKC